MGGMLLLGGGYLLATLAQRLTAAAVVTSAIKIGGGFAITQKYVILGLPPTLHPSGTLFGHLNCMV